MRLVPGSRARAATEIALIVGAVLLIIWVIKPRGEPALDLGLRIAVAVLMLASPWIHRNPPQRIGLRLDNFWPALRVLLPLTTIAAGGFIVAGFLMRSIDPPERPALELAYYLAWAFVQQYALQAVVLRRLDDAGLRRGAPLAAAVLFSLVHAPNPGLMILTFAGACLWCSTFARYPNLPAVAVSHAVLAVIAASTLPPSVTGEFRLGPSYLQLEEFETSMIDDLT